MIKDGSLVILTEVWLRSIHINQRSTSVKSGYFGTTPRQRIIASSLSDESMFIYLSVPKQGGLSLRSALASICLTRSRVTPINCPIYSSVITAPSSPRPSSRSRTRLKLLFQVAAIEHMLQLVSGVNDRYVFIKPLFKARLRFGLFHLNC